MPSLLLFAGLPHDVREPDLAELLTADPVRLTPSSVAVTALHDSAGAFLGTFLVQVGADADAEKVRRQFSGQVIDGTHTLAVHHVLQPTVPHPSVVPPKAAVVVPKPVPAVKAAVAPRAAPQPKKKDTQPPGLKLLSRLGKGGKAGEKEKQKLLLEKQRAALRRGNPGDLLAARLGKAKPAAGSPRGAAAKTKAAKGAKAGGSAKTARAKGAGAARMDVDAAPAAPKHAAAKKDDKPRPKTQAELDEEMRAYERARRFA